MAKTKRPARDPDEIDRGVFAVSRGFLYNDQFKDETFTEREAFLWMISTAAWRDRVCDGQYGAIQLRRGEFYASIRFMAMAWQWDKAKVSRYIKKLISKEMLGSENRDSEIVYFLPNYNKFQRVSLPNRDASETSPRRERDKLEDIEYTLTSDTNVSSVSVGSDEPTPSLASDEKATKAKRKRAGYDPIFEEFWKGYPKTLVMSKKEAGDVWQKLPEDDRSKAMQALPLFVRYCRDNPDYPVVHACRFLSKRRADGFVDSETVTSTKQEVNDAEFRRKLAEQWEGSDEERELEELRRIQGDIPSGRPLRIVPAKRREIHRSEEGSWEGRPMLRDQPEHGRVEGMGALLPKVLRAVPLGDDGGSSRATSLDDGSREESGGFRELRSADCKS